MHKNLNPLTLAVRHALIMGALALAGTSNAVAQESGEENAEQLDQIVVTGSRIRRAVDAETAQPVLTFSREELAKTGLSNIGDVLTNLVVADNSTVTTVNNNTNGNDGTIEVSLRGLGSARTLVLVNGRRWVGNENGVVDLNSIPLSIVQSIEILKDGASALYGSDAIAGVVNIITKRTYEGAEVNGYYGQNSEGDGEVANADFTLGGSSDRMNFVANFAYSEQKEIFAGDREISRPACFGLALGICDSSFTERGRFQVPGNTGPGGAGNITLIPGRPGTSPNDFRAYNGLEDAYNFSPINYLQQPFERFSVFAQANFAVTEGVTFSNTVNYIKRKGSQVIAEVPLTLAASGTSGPQWDFGTESVAANNVFNPFGRPVTFAGFRMRELGPRTNIFDYDTFAYTGVFDGSFDLGGRAMFWDVGYQYQEFTKDSAGENYVNLFNLRNALGPSFRDTGGVLRCGTPGQVIAGCVPFNLFSGRDLGLSSGRISAAEQRAMLEYVGYTLVETEQTQLYNFTANLTGSLMDLPAGELGFAVGYEYRKYNYTDQPDALISEGGSSTNFREPTDGFVQSDELYLELNIPVVVDAPLAKQLDISLATRYSDYSSEGLVGTTRLTPDLGDDTSSKISLLWKPIDDLLVRGTFAQTFRAPSVDDLFGGGGESFPQVNDPCRSQAGGFATLSPASQARCISQGVTAGGYVQPNSQIRTLVGGNPNLTPETGDTVTLGFVYSPSQIENLNFSVDWYRIELDEGLATFTGNTILSRCIRDLEDQFCGFFTRAPGGEILTLRAVPFNAQELGVEGFDFGTNYALDTDYGTFRWNLNTSYQSDNFTVAQGSDERDNDVGELIGDSANWRWRGNLATTWTYGPWEATWNLRYTSRLDEECGYADLFEAGLADFEACIYLPGADGGVVAENRIGSVTYHDLQGKYVTPWEGSVSVGLRNAFDKDPPLSTNTFANSFPQGYDVPGRFWYLSYNQKF